MKFHVVSLWDDMHTEYSLSQANQLLAGPDHVTPGLLDIGKDQLVSQATEWEH